MCIRCVLVLCLFSLMVGWAYGRSPDLASLSPEKVAFKICVFATSEPDETDALNLPGIEAEEIRVPPGLVEDQLPPALKVALKSLTKEDNLILYFFQKKLEDARKGYPLRELANVVNSLPCRYVITIIDIPTTAKPYPDIKPAEVVSIRTRCEMFRKGLTIFTSRPFDPRLLEHDSATFFHYFRIGVINGFANTNRDDAITVWEAYQYAFWSTFARAIKDSQVPQVAMYTLKENWVAQPILALGRTDSPESDPQPSLFSKVSIPLPVDQAKRQPTIFAHGPVGPTLFSPPFSPEWLDEPPDPLAVSDWAWQMIDEVRDELRDLEITEQALSLLTEGQASLAPSPHTLGLDMPYSTIIGPQGPPGASGTPPLGAEDCMFRGFDDTELLQTAKSNFSLLLQSQAEVHRVRASAQLIYAERLWQLYYLLTGPISGTRCEGVPWDWPKGLGYAPAGVIDPIPGPPGPPGVPGPAFSGSAANLGKRPPLWSEEVTQELTTLTERIQQIESRMQSLRYRDKQ